MILGIDLGSKFIKTSTGQKIDNKISTREPMLEDSIRMTFEGENYVIGEGEFQTATNKVEREGLLLTLFTAIAMSSKDQKNKVVLGLPIQYYKPYKDMLKKKIMENNFREVTYNGAKRHIIITDVEVAPEGAVGFKSLNNKILTEIGEMDLVIIDVGGRTTDICLYRVINGRRQIVKYKSVTVGILNIYDEIAQAVNSAYALDKSLEDGEQILTEGLLLYGKKQDLTFIKPILKAQTDKIFKELNMNFPVTTAHCLLLGGGSLTLEGLFRKNLPHVIVANEPIFGNAIGMKKVGEDLWGRSSLT